MEKLTVKHYLVLKDWLDIAQERWEIPYAWGNPVSLVSQPYDHHLIAIDRGCVVILRHACIGRYIAKLRFPPLSLSGDRNAEKDVLRKYLSMGASCITNAPTETLFSLKKAKGLGRKECFIERADLKGKSYRNLRRQLLKYKRLCEEGLLVKEILSTHEPQYLGLHKQWTQSHWGVEYNTFSNAMIGDKFFKSIAIGHLDKSGEPAHFISALIYGDYLVGSITCRNPSKFPNLSLGSIAIYQLLQTSLGIKGLNAGDSRTKGQALAKQRLEFSEVDLYRIQPFVDMNKKTWEGLKPL